MSITSVVNDLVTSVSVINALKPLPPTISGYSVGGVDDTALDPAGGQTVQINGTGFLAGATITFDGSAVAVVTYVNPNQLTFTSPAKSAGTYTIYVVNSDGGTAIFIPGIIYSVLPTWTTSAGSLGSYYETTSISNTVVASGDAPITYSLFSGSLPTGSTLYANGVITGTAPVDSSSTTYSFTIQATDAQLQDSTRSFSLTINVDAVTWVSPANATTYTSAVDSAISNVALSATDAAGYNVSYSANALPTGLTLTGSNIAGTPTVIADSSTLLTATAATTNRTATRTINWSITVANDTYFEYNTLLIPGASTTFVDDASTNNFAISIFGDTKPNSFGPYTPGYYSNYFDGSSDYIRKAGGGVLTSSGDVTIECWIYPASTSVVGLFDGGTGEGEILRNFPANTISRQNNEGTGAAFTVTANTWQHFACTFTAGAIKVFINGSLNGTGTYSSTYNSGSNFDIGVINTGGNGSFNGYVSNFRVTKSILYTTTFTPSTTPLTAIANTSLLTCQSNRFIDNSTNNFTLTVAGNTTINSFTPFTPNSNYSTYGSGYFDGTGDYLTVPGNSVFAFGTGDFTLEVWLYANSISTGTFDRICATSDYNGSGFDWTLNTSTSSLYVVGTAYSIGSITTKTWHHLVYTRSGSVIRGFLNGNLSSYTTGASQNVVSTSTLNIGTGYSGTPLNGYLVDLRIIKGSIPAGYQTSSTTTGTQIFTPPSEPLTAVANTSLLTLQNNQSVNNSVFLDNSSNNFLVTRYGNTTQGTFSPYGGNWSNFYGTTTMGWQTPAASATTIIGTATLTSASTFTVEAWVYQLTRHSGGGAVLGYVFGSMNISGGQADWTIGPNSDGKLTVFWYNSGNNICNSTNTVPLNTWTHIAVSINAGAISMYINGVKETLTGTTTATTTSGSPLGYLASGGYTYGGSTWQGFNGYISNLRVVKSALYSVTFTPSTTPLTAISGTSLLTCQSNRFIDTSINSFTLTITNALTIQRFSPFNPSIVTATSYSGYFDGNGDYLTAPSTAVFAFGTSAYTIEAWVYVTSRSTEASIWATGAQNNNFLITTGGLVRLYNGTSYTGTTVIALNTWAHVAVVRTSTATNGAQLFVNGVSDLVFTDTTNQTSATTGIIGVNNPASNQYFPGYISNLRIVKAVAVYTGAFTPPTSPLTATQSSGANIAAITGTSTSLLTCQSTTFIDNSTNNFTITAFGNSQPTQQNPFGFTSALTNGYTVSTIGGSGYFDNAGDYLTVPSTVQLEPGSGNFTIEAWVYPLSYPSAGSGDGIIARLNSSGYNNFSVNLRSNGNIEAYFSLASPASVPAIITAGSILLNSWTHIAFVKNGLSTTLYVNGVSVGTATSASNPPTGLSTVTNIGTADSDFNGYISGLRVTKSIVYSSGFVPPATPSTAITNTALLLNYTGAGIYDAAMMTNMETVADAKLSTAVSKFGGSSVSFDGTGDYLSTYNPSYSLSVGSGDFTYECWLYVNALPGLVTSVYHLKNDTGLATTVFVLELTTNGAISISTGTAIIAYGTAGKITTGSWIHFAFVRTSGVFKTFFNGIQDISVANTTAYNGTYLFIGAWRYSSYDNSLNGYLDDIRITKGVARYTSNFTPPTSAFPIY